MLLALYMIMECGPRSKSSTWISNVKHGRSHHLQIYCMFLSIADIEPPSSFMSVFAAWVSKKISSSNINQKEKFLYLKVFIPMKIQEVFSSSCSLEVMTLWNLISLNECVWPFCGVGAYRVNVQIHARWKSFLLYLKVTSAKKLFFVIK